MSCKQKLKLEYLAFSNVHLNIIVIIEYLYFKERPAARIGQRVFKNKPVCFHQRIRCSDNFSESYLLKFLISSLIRTSVF